jgi:hypothetical protein
MCTMTPAESEVIYTLNPCCFSALIRWSSSGDSRCFTISRCLDLSYFCVRCCGLLLVRIWHHELFHPVDVVDVCDAFLGGRVKFASVRGAGEEAGTREFLYVVVDDGEVEVRLID